MARQLASWTALLGVVVTLAIGPGLTLNRCLLTGQVSVHCCCAGADVGTPDGLGDPAESCCNIQRLTPPWTSAETSRHVRPALIAIAASLPQLVSTLRSIATTPAVFEPVVAESPPLWLGAPRI
jgi:hypothetical protein